MQRDQDAQMLKKSRVELRRLTAAPDVDARSLVFAENVRMSTELMPTTGPGPRVSWFSFGAHGCKFTSAGGEDKFPKEWCLLCFRLVVLSKEHLLLLTGFVIGWVILALDIVSSSLAARKNSDPDKSSPFHGVWITAAQILLVEVCLVTMLLRFEELDIIQQLEREVRGMEAQVKNVETQRKKMREFWSNAQQLTELWLYRTVPRLDLYKEIHSQLEDSPSEDLLVNISGANSHLENLELHLGALEAWRNDGELKADAKKKFGKAINQLCQETELDEILVKLEDVSKSATKSLTQGELKLDAISLATSNSVVPSGSSRT
jgi:hypothetical protein